MIKAKKSKTSGIKLIYTIQENNERGEKKQEKNLINENLMQGGSFQCWMNASILVLRLHSKFSQFTIHRSCLKDHSLTGPSGRGRKMWRVPFNRDILFILIFFASNTVGEAVGVWDVYICFKFYVHHLKIIFAFEQVFENTVP